MLFRDWGWWSGLKPAPQGHRCLSQEKREARRSPRYLELYIVADRTLVRGTPRGLAQGWSSLSSHSALLLPFQFLTQHRNLNHTKQRLLEVANYVDQVEGGGNRALLGMTVTGVGTSQGTW